MITEVWLRRRPWPQSVMIYSDDSDFELQVATLCNQFNMKKDPLAKIHLQMEF